MKQTISIQINFEIDEDKILYGEDKPIKNFDEYKVFIEEEVKTILKGLYPPYENLNINVI